MIRLEKFGLREVLLVWLAGFCISFGLQSFAGGWFSPHTPRELFDMETTRVARSLIETGQFRDPFAKAPTGPTAHVAPAYPVLYGVVIAIFGREQAGFLALRVLTIAAYSLAGACLPWLAVLCGLRPWVGFTAALLSAVMPIPGRCFKWESLFVALLLVALMCFTLAWLEQRRLKTVLILGALWGTTMLFTPSVTPVWLVWGALMAYRGRFPTFGQAMAFWALPLAIVAPWLVRNYYAFGQFVFVRSNLGLELVVSNNDCASSWSLDNLRSGCSARFHPNENLVVARQVAALGEPRFNALQLEKAISWIRANPFRFARLTVERAWRFWFPPPHHEKGAGYWNVLLISLLTALGIPGLVLLARANRSAALLCGSCLAVFPLIHYIVQVDLRYRYPILWISTFLACVAMYRLAGSFGHLLRNHPDAHGAHENVRRIVV